MYSGRKSISLDCNEDVLRKWLLGHLHIIQAKALAANLVLPIVYVEKIQAVPDSSPNEINLIGESLLIATIKYLDDKGNRLKYIQLLIDRGADINFQDKRERRTALMYTCIEDNRTDEGLMIAKSKNCNFDVQDRLGNTALMYAAMKGRDELMNFMVDALAKGWSLSVLQLTNCMGHTAEDLAIRNGHHRCARIVQTQRLHLLACLNRQIGMVGQTGCRYWDAFAAIYKCIDKWKPRQRRKSADPRSFRLLQTKPTVRKNSM
uniref:ANK_REP_REGION domain-containing protein n=1 Tax=Setaria digitata TaxID=48799 RepID=A0A915PS85_9BILA